MRLPRLSMPNVAHHVLLRSNNKEKIFLNSHDYQVYLQFLEESAHKNGCAVNAFCLMVDHVHLMITPNGDGNVSKLMQAMGRKYTQYFNVRHNREGSLFTPRYKAALVAPEYELDVVRYIETNPVSNKLVAEPSDFKWSSYRFHDPDINQKHGFIKTPSALTALSDCKRKRLSLYKKYCSKVVDFSMLQKITKETLRSRVIGEQEFIQFVEDYCGVDLFSKGLHSTKEG